MSAAHDRLPELVARMAKWAQGRIDECRRLCEESNDRPVCESGFDEQTRSTIEWLTLAAVLDMLEIPVRDTKLTDEDIDRTFANAAKTIKEVERSLAGVVSHDGNYCPPWNAVSEPNVRDTKPGEP